MSRVGDRSWLSRFVVHAPVGTLQNSYFADFTVSALRVTARLKSKKGRSLSSEQILDLICGRHGEEMEIALEECHQDVFVYRNMLKRLQTESDFTPSERAEIAMVLLLTAGCTADVRRAVSIAMEFARSIRGQRVATPLVTPTSRQMMTSRAARAVDTVTTLGLLRVVDDYVVGAPHWIPADAHEAFIGSIVTEGYCITDVEPDVSSKHARLFIGDDGAWYIEGLGSLNGTVLISGNDQKRIVIEPPKSDRASGDSVHPVKVNPGDRIIVGVDTTFVVLEGMPSF